VDPKQIIDLRTFLPYRVHILSTYISNPGNRTTADGDMIRPRDWRVLLQLAVRGPLTNSEIAAVVGMDGANVSRVVRYLADCGLVVSRPSSLDGRKQIVSLTAKGVAAHDALAPARFEEGLQMISCLSAEEQDQLFTMLDKLEAHLARTVDDDWLDD
jgi:DNA-binding MarR family transcriptional regulator